MDQSIKQNIKSDSQWLRLLFIVLYGIAYQVAELVVLFIVIIQVLFALFTGAPNQKLTQFVGGVNQFIFQILQFVTYKTDEKPFPFQDWPESSAALNKSSAQQEEPPEDKQSAADKGLGESK
ncbi:DUF4389 domain-containing protein [Spartinivicinus ruber]|uniref:DUF4389 domain-containing protein n=1 Tax=Spartinivicinus ruber TaxID=2683272 RepID=UPI0013D717BE|nr:DUF4389 domain-containing protein [Spartinivicinus ruber]